MRFKNEKVKWALVGVMCNAIALTTSIYAWSMDASLVMAVVFFFNCITLYFNARNLCIAADGQ